MPEFLMGFVIGALMLLLAVFIVIDVDQEACAKEHNTYTCKQIWVPKEAKP